MNAPDAGDFLQILVVEDAAPGTEAGSLQAMLAQAPAVGQNHHYTFTASLDEAVQLCCEGTIGQMPDLVVLDLALFGSDAGAGAIRTFKTRCMQTALIAVVGAGERVAALDAGAQDVVFQDAFDAAELIGLIGHVASRDHLATRLRQHELALNSVPAAIAITDEKGIFQWGNSAFTRLTGYGIDEAYGCALEQVTNEQQPEILQPEKRQPRLRRPRHCGEQLNRHKDGSLYYARCDVTPVVDVDGHSRHFVSVYQDISANKRMEELLEAFSMLQQEAIAGLRINDAFAYMLQLFLEITESPFGFMAEVNYVGEHAAAQANIHAFWSRDYLPFLEDPESEGNFSVLEPFYQRSLQDAQALVCNSAWMEEGFPLHPALPAFESFACLPVFGFGEFAALIVIANRADGYDEGLENLLRPLLNCCGSIIAWKRSQIEAQSAHARLHGLLLGRERENAVFLDSGGRISEYHLTDARLLLSEPPARFQDLPFRDVLHSGLVRHLDLALAAIRKNGKTQQFTCHCGDQDVGTYQVRLSRLVHTQQGSAGYLLLIEETLPEAAPAHDSAHAGEQGQAVAVLQRDVDEQGACITLDAAFRIKDVRPSFTRLSGFSASILLGQKAALFDVRKHDEAFCEAVWECAAQYGVWQGEINLMCADGDSMPVWACIDAEQENGTLTHYQCVFSSAQPYDLPDVAAYNMAAYDPVTNLPGRSLLVERLRIMLESPDELDYQNNALLFIDLDHFKNINDALGHNVGDRILQRAVQRIVDSVRTHDVVARAGGDEFIVLLQGLGKDQESAVAHAELVANNIRLALNQPFHIERQECNITSSIGVTLYSGAGSDSVDDVFKRADLAIYQAKNGGRNTIRFFDQAMQEAFDYRTGLEADLRYALATDSLRLYFQPQVDLDGQVFGAEALLRWPHPLHGMVSPAVFIPIAEDSDLIIEIGNWVLRTSCRQIRNWSHRPDTRHITLAVNVSARQFRHPDFVRDVLKAVALYSINPQRLKLELTESLLVDDVDSAIDVIGQLKEHGIGFALDDFGSGYSSLAYLKNLPLDQLKIDQSFVRDILSEQSDEIIVRTIVALGRNLGMSVIAEGVETVEQMSVLARHGCNLYQGYLFGRPSPAEDFNATARLAEVLSGKKG